MWDGWVGCGRGVCTGGVVGSERWRDEVREGKIRVKTVETGRRKRGRATVAAWLLSPSFFKSFFSDFGCRLLLKLLTLIYFYFPFFPIKINHPNLTSLPD